MISKVKKSIAFGVPAILLASPFVAHAQTFTAILTTVENIITQVIPIMIGLAVLVFMWGVFKYVIASGEDDKSAGRSFMIWGIIALFVMTSVWGLVNLLDESLSLQNTTPQAPGLPQ